MFGKSAITALLGLASTTLAASTINKQCQGDVCYSLNIPDASAAQTAAPLYLQITGPSSYGWIAMGTGSTMAGSKMLIIYQSANGQNVTLSGRSATGQIMPMVDPNVKAELLEGSGIVNGQMVANIRCPMCSTTAAEHIYAIGTGAMQSDDVAAPIQKHSKYGFFSFDIASAKGGEDVNPFVSATSTTNSGGSSCTTNGPSVGQGSASFPFFGGSRPTGFPGGPRMSKRQQGCVNGQTPAQQAAMARLSAYRTKLIAHGVLACLCFAILFPLGAISIRLLSFPGLVWFHAGLQILTLILFIIAFALGIIMARERMLIEHYHPIIGIVLFVLLFLQPICGQLHHMKFAEAGGRTAWSYLHIWLGRALITLGIINGGLGFQLAANSRSGVIAYGIIAGIMWLLYVTAAVVGERKRIARPPPPKSNEGYSSGPNSPAVYAYETHQYDMPAPR